ncbi:MAG: hypothetical protein JRM72_07525 [Nitrososphaerota archaeon]|jgi:hypothetical protein|nr:hypothetical protein [Nitrososphaerota archaeon]MDG7042826.1 hypothetical protein [Nitrososphaerota archaeon]
MLSWTDGRGEEMGRVTPAFREEYKDVLGRLRRGYVQLLRDSGDRRAFEELVAEAWDLEHAAMTNSEMATIVDSLNLTANVHNRAEIDDLRKQLLELQERLHALEKR